MYIEDRLFSENRPTEVLYSIMMTEEEYTLFSEFQKEFTRWDDTDQLKKMRDSDILAEKKKSGTLGNTATKMGMGFAGGAGIGALAGGAQNFISKGNAKTLDEKLAKMTKWFALVFAVLSLILSLL